MQHIYKYDIIQSIGEDHLSMVAVIDGCKFYLTFFFNAFIMVVQDESVIILT